MKHVRISDLNQPVPVFEAARQRTAEACEACNAAGREADRLMPERPSVLTLRESDHLLRIYREITYPTALQGRDLMASDVEWLRRRMPMMSGLYARAERRGQEPHGPTLLRLVRRWLAIHEQIGTLLPGIPEPPHVQEVRSLLDTITTK